MLPAWFSTSEQAGHGPQPMGSLAAGQCTPATSLALALTVPPFTVSRGNTAGDVYTVTVTNNGTVSTTEVSLLIDPNAGFYYLGGSATVASSISGTLTYADTGTGAPDGSSTITVSGNALAQALQPGETMTFTFRLATDANATSGQALAVSLRSGSPTPVVCKTVTDNIPTARGNLTVVKDSITQFASYGDTITWTVALRNTGLGTVYNARVTDTIGAGYTAFSITPAPSNVTLAPNASRNYVVQATVNSCTDLGNKVQATWSIGNVDGTGTGANPVRDDADVIFQLEEPAVTVQIGPLPAVAYCGALNATIPVTVTNTGGAARNLRLNLSAAGVSATEQSGNWTQSGNTLTYTGGTPAGTLGKNQTITFNILVTAANVCATTQASLSLAPVYQDACLLQLVSGTAGTRAQTLAPTAPTLSLDKSGPGVVNAGAAFQYLVTASGTNRGSMSAINVTDAAARRYGHHRPERHRGYGDHQRQQRHLASWASGVGTFPRIVDHQRQGADHGGRVRRGHQRRQHGQRSRRGLPAMHAHRQRLAGAHSFRRRCRRPTP